TFAHILSFAATLEGKYGQSSQAVTIERRGAPTQGFARIGDRPIAERGLIANPDYVVSIDPTLIEAVDLEAGMTENGMLVVNSPVKPELKHKFTYFDATSIALDVLKNPITNTVMLGGFVAATGLVSLESIIKSTRSVLDKKLSDKILERNITAISQAYEEVKNG
ncbi:MAG: pyruvate ferredoxin oxidoreductase, partial [Nitrospina sp.]|nr:pyruvate ferredoxin oxidoreductase [Nitrospina sp.]